VGGESAEQPPDASEEGERPPEESAE
jgi:hypothetical protein